jgi:hypothetical protein
MNKTRLIDMFHCFSVASFFRSLGTIFHTFFCSISHRRYLITTILLIMTWSVSILIGVFNSSHFTQSTLVLDNFDNYNLNLGCRLDEIFTPVNYFCTTKRREALEFNHMFSMDDLIFLLLLLVIPNFVVLLSYSWVCYHIWSHSLSFLNGWTIGTCMRKVIDHHETQQKFNMSTTSNNAGEQTVCNQGHIENENLISPNGPSSPNLTSSAANMTRPQPTTAHNYTIKKRNIYITLSTFLMIFCFSVCWTPFFIFPIFYSKITDTNLYNNIKVFVHLIGYSSSVLNPFILITKSKRFKPKLKIMKEKLASLTCNQSNR